jgi:hypothetical protein
MNTSWAIESVDQIIFEQFASYILLRRRNDNLSFNNLLQHSFTPELFDRLIAVANHIA